MSYHRSQKTKKPIQQRPLYRSSSTSQLNVKCDDSTNGVNLKKNSTLSAAVKSSSCDDITQGCDNKRRGFPYAFIRSKLSVLPEENGGSVLKPGTLSRVAKQADSKMTMNLTIDSTHRLDYYQQLNCLSSNESGYDSNGHHAEDNFKIEIPEINGIYQQFNLNLSVNRRKSLLPTVDVNDPKFDCGTIQRKFRQIKLKMRRSNDKIGIILKQRVFKWGEVHAETRYLIAEINEQGLAYK